MLKYKLEQSYRKKVDELDRGILEMAELEMSRLLPKDSISICETKTDNVSESPMILSENLKCYQNQTTFENILKTSDPFLRFIRKFEKSKNLHKFRLVFQSYETGLLVDYIIDRMYDTDEKLFDLERIAFNIYLLKTIALDENDWPKTTAQICKLCEINYNKIEKEEINQYKKESRRLISYFIGINKTQVLALYEIFKIDFYLLEYTLNKYLWASLSNS